MFRRRNKWTIEPADIVAQGRSTFDEKVKCRDREAVLRNPDWTETVSLKVSDTSVGKSYIVQYCIEKVLHPSLQLEELKAAREKTTYMSKSFDTFSVAEAYFLKLVKEYGFELTDHIYQVGNV